MKTREEVRALTRALSCTCRSYEFSQDSTETTTCRKQSVGWVLLGGGVLRRARRCVARTRQKIPEPPCRGKRDLRPVDDCDVRRPTADNRDVGGRTSNVERPKRGEDFPEGRPGDITTESTEVAPRSPKDQGAEPRSGKKRRMPPATQSRGGILAWRGADPATAGTERELDASKIVLDFAGRGA